MNWSNSSKINFEKPWLSRRVIHLEANHQKRLFLRFHSPEKHSPEKVIEFQKSIHLIRVLTIWFRKWGILKYIQCIPFRFTYFRCMVTARGVPHYIACPLGLSYTGSTCPVLVFDTTSYKHDWYPPSYRPNWSTPSPSYRPDWDAMPAHWGIPPSYRPNTATPLVTGLTGLLPPG